MTKPSAHQQLHRKRSFAADQKLWWYLLFGVLHELSHLFVAWLLSTPTDGSVNLELKNIYGVVVGRHVLLDAQGETFIHIIRHTGWAVSVLVALAINLLSHGGQGDFSSSIRWAASITAMEAIVTDLLQLPAGLSFLCSFDASTSTEILYCGNFGLILMHHAWFLDSRALDVLEQMIKVTMMRGAQSGGVIVYHPQKDGTLKGVRSRVVNRKRTDLSLLLRQKVARDNHLHTLPKHFVPFLAGHTRFATSSKASFEGTHPQQWTSEADRLVYNLDVKPGQTHDFTPRRVKVANNITHNGDFDFLRVNGKSYDLERIQNWLATVLHCPMPAPVDSCAVAGVVDLLRTRGCFGLSARYAVSIGLPTSRVDEFVDFPSYKYFEEKIGQVFQSVLQEMLKATSFGKIEDSPFTRRSFAERVASKLSANDKLLEPLVRLKFIDDEAGASTLVFCLTTIDAFFDNDLFWTTQTFLANASGSFGLVITSSIDAHRQICLASRGQTMSVAFYPRKGIICYGSEQAAVKAGLKAGNPCVEDELGRSQGDVDNDALRLDLDDLNGEILVLDWGGSLYVNPPVSVPSQKLPRHDLMNGRVTAILYKESKATADDPQIYHRMTRLSRNRFVKPLPDDSKDLILQDIHDIPRVCAAIQDDWHSDQAATSLNRLTAHTLAVCLRKRLDEHVAGTVSDRAVDILLTGCEVSLWLAEQFASDLQKAFPRLRIVAVSSNKLLGLYGQDICVPAFGFPYAPKTYDLHDTIVIIVSHSGGTFAPLSCSSLLQSTTRNIFVVTSEWDTQISKQLRAMDALENVDSLDQLFRNRVFSTEVGMRPAEPCSLSVAATHQLLTNLFEYISVLIISDVRYCRATAATISGQDLLILECCNRNNIEALSEIVGVNKKGYEYDVKEVVEKDLRDAGNLWADHILENAKAYIMTFCYIFASVISGFPLAFAIAYAAGLRKDNDWVYLIHAIDAAIYFWLPQINVTLIRLWEGRNLLHRMVGRTVVIGDIPWVAQSAEAFLSKIFAVSYSIAGLNVLSANPADHLVHRHTHRVVRGSLVICGRPDGRLSALSTAEAAVSLSVNQASSIQSLGCTCESITIGHNPFKLPLTARAVILKRKRPLFFCERLLIETDEAEEKEKNRALSHSQSNSTLATSLPDRKRGVNKLLAQSWNRISARKDADPLDLSLSRHADSSIRLRLHRRRSAAALLGTFRNFEEKSEDEFFDTEDEPHELSVHYVVDAAIRERKWSDRARKLFQAFDLDNDGFLTEEEFIKSSYRLQAGLTEEELRNLFKLADRDSSGHLDYDEFLSVLHISDLESGIKLPPSHRDARGLIQIEPSREKYFGETLRKYNAGKKGKNFDFMVARSQENAMQLYETRIASLQRFVAMVVMFHQMGKRVENFFDKISFGLLTYRMDRTHSIMRIATTASPISGADVRQRMRQLQLLKKAKHSTHLISTTWLRYKGAKKLKESQHSVPQT